MKHSRLAMVVVAVLLAGAACDQPRHLERPAFIRGIYVNPDAIQSPPRLAYLVALARNTEINTFVIDVKDDRGVIYPSKIPLALIATGTRRITIPDLSALSDSLHRQGIYLIARIVVFKDPSLVRARPELAIRTPTGKIWRDRSGTAWVSPWEKDAWAYNIAIAEEVAKAGFDEIQFDYVRMPEPSRRAGRQVHRNERGARSNAIAGFLTLARATLGKRGARIGADLFGYATADPGDVGIGQHWESVALSADVVSPMVYPSHYTRATGKAHPNRLPYETIYNSLRAGVRRSRALRKLDTNPAEIIPWLQAFDAPWVDPGYHYGSRQAIAQLEAVYALGIESWLFWNPRSDYSAIQAAFGRHSVSRSGDRAWLRSSSRAVAQMKSRK